MNSRLQNQLELACLWEATARKPGNVHPAASFANTTYHDFVTSAAAIASPLSRAAEIGVGPAILEAVRATQQTTGQNTNLGIILLLAPLAACPENMPPVFGIHQVLQNLRPADADAVYEAIRLANPGGLGKVASHDVSEPPTLTLWEAMKLAADRDRVAAQYANGFSLVLSKRFDMTLEWNAHADLADSPGWEQAVIGLQLSLMSEFPDTLIARKCGPEIAAESATRAAAVLDAAWPDSAAGWEELRRFDAWLRADGHRRNPGTTADLIAAILFAGMLEGLPSPSKTTLLDFAASSK